jgi:hypothetical protein
LLQHQKNYPFFSETQAAPNQAFERILMQYFEQYWVDEYLYPCVIEKYCFHLRMSNN